MLQAQNPPASPLTASPTSVALSYQKPASPGNTVTVTFKATNATTFVIDPSTVPFWATVGAPSGQATSAGATVTFDASNVAATLNAGGYNGFVHAKVSGFADLIIPVSLTVTDPASTLTVTDSLGGNASLGETIPWQYGSAYPTLPLTMVSSDAPIGFNITVTVTPAGAPANWISFTHTSGVAYTYGTLITASFLSDILYNATVGASIAGQITVTPSNGGAAINIPITINVTEPAAAITRIFPAQTPVQNNNSIKVIVTGSGFGTGGGYAAEPTAVSVIYGPGPTTALLTAVGGAVAVPNQNTLILTIPKDDGGMPAIPILSAAGTVTISIQNGNIGSAVTTPLTVTASPIILSVTDGASMVEAAPGSNPTFAPYEMIALFGGNFGPTAGTPVEGALDGFDRYHTALLTNGHNLTVAFYKADGVTLIANAYLLFATNNQINALVPSGVTGNATVQIVASWNGLNSTAFVANIAAEDPGVFTVTSSGQGQGAVLLSDYSLNSASNPGLAGKSTVLIYLTGLGAPNSAGANSNAATAKFPTTCVSPANYIATINALPGNAGWTTIDGAVIQSSQLKTNVLPPCMATANAVTVSIGGQPATVSYAGWVGGSVAGLYQINALVPAKANPSVANPPAVSTVPVVVTIGGVSSQAGVTMSVK